MKQQKAAKQMAVNDVVTKVNKKKKLDDSDVRFIYGLFSLTFLLKNYYLSLGWKLDSELNFSKLYRPHQIDLAGKQETTEPKRSLERNPMQK